MRVLAHAVGSGDSVLTERPLQYIKTTTMVSRGLVSHSSLGESHAAATQYFSAHAAEKSAFEADWVFDAYSLFENLVVGHGVYPEMSKLPHSCNPNTMCNFGKEDGVARLYAVRSIARGEPLTVSKIPYLGFQTYGNRQILLRKYGYLQEGQTCRCAQCLADALVDSDMQAHIRTWSSVFESVNSLFSAHN